MLEIAVVAVTGLALVLSSFRLPAGDSLIGGDVEPGRAEVETGEALAVDLFDHALTGAPTRLLVHGGDIPLTARFLPGPQVPRSG